MKERLFARGMTEYSGLKVVDDDLLGNAIKELERVTVTGEELLHAFG